MKVSGSQHEVTEGHEDENVATDEQPGEDGKQVPGEESQPTLLQSMLSMGAEQEQQAEGRYTAAIELKWENTNSQAP